MAKILKSSLKIIVPIIIILAIFNINLSTNQCIQADGYTCRVIRIPLYLKTLDFLDRHFNYKRLASSITEGVETDQEKAIKIFNWSHANIRRVPAGFPIVDDHIWNIAIRGYGTSDQVCDVFSTLCAYSGMPAFWAWIGLPGTKSRIPVSLVKINGQWRIFDPYLGFYLSNKKGEIASVQEIILDRSLIEQIPAETKVFGEVSYRSFFQYLDRSIEKQSDRTLLQSPVYRAGYLIKKLISRIGKRP